MRQINLYIYLTWFFIIIIIIPDNEWNAESNNECKDRPGRGHFLSGANHPFKSTLDSPQKICISSHVQPGILLKGLDDRKPCYDLLPRINVRGE